MNSTKLNELMTAVREREQVLKDAEEERSETFNQWRFALQRAIIYFESFAISIEKGRFDDHYSALMIREDLEQLRSLEVWLRQPHEEERKE